MKLHVTILATVPLGLLLTGCPLTDHYQLAPEGTAGAETGGDRPVSGGGGLNGGETGVAGVADAGEPASSGGGPNTASGGSANPAGGGNAVGGGDVDMAGSATGGGSAVCNDPCNAGRCVAGICNSGWVAMAEPPSALVARAAAASVATGKSVFIWGGLSNAGQALTDGAIYTPSSNTWTYLPKASGSPSGRVLATAVWTGATSNKVIVYGGANAAGDTVYHDGAVYDLSASSWTALPSNSNISARSAPFGYWDGTRAVFFGGINANGTGVPGADRFDLSSWSISKSGDPGKLAYPAAAVDGAVLYLQGGLMDSARQDKVFSYNSSANSWSSLNKSLSPRSAAFGTWDGSHFVVWGGRDDPGLRSDGKLLSGSAWSSIPASEALGARMVGFRRSGWSFQVRPGVSAILGGIISLGASSAGDDDTLATDGASYDTATAKWTAIADWTSHETHEYGVGVWTGEEFVLWGGGDANASTLLGERWAP